MQPSNVANDPDILRQAKEIPRFLPAKLLGLHRFDIDPVVQGFDIFRFETGQAGAYVVTH